MKKSTLPLETILHSGNLESSLAQLSEADPAELFQELDAETAKQCKEQAVVYLTDYVENRVRYDATRIRLENLAHLIQDFGKPPILSQVFQELKAKRLQNSEVATLRERFLLQDLYEHQNLINKVSANGTGEAVKATVGMISLGSEQCSTPLEFVAGDILENPFVLAKLINLPFSDRRILATALGKFSTLSTRQVFELANEDPKVLQYAADFFQVDHKLDQALRYAQNPAVQLQLDKVEDKDNARKFWIETFQKERTKFSLEEITKVASLPSDYRQSWKDLVVCTDYRKEFNALPEETFKAVANLYSHSSTDANEESLDFFGGFDESLKRGNTPSWANYALRLIEGNNTRKNAFKFAEKIAGLAESLQGFKEKDKLFLDYFKKYANRSNAPDADVSDLERIAMLFASATTDESELIANLGGFQVVLELNEENLARVKRIKDISNKKELLYKLSFYAGGRSMEGLLDYAADNPSSVLENAVNLLKKKTKKRYEFDEVLAISRDKRLYNKLGKIRAAYRQTFLKLATTVRDAQKFRQLPEDQFYLAAQAYEFAQQNRQENAFLEGFNESLEQGYVDKWAQTIIDHFREDAKGGGNYRSVINKNREVAVA